MNKFLLIFFLSLILSACPSQEETTVTTENNISSDNTTNVVIENKNSDTFKEITSVVEKADLGESEIGIATKYRYTIDKTPFDSNIDFPYGPDSWRNVYGLTRQFFAVLKSEEIGVIWQDQNTGSPIISWLGSDLLTPQNFVLPNNKASESLAAAISDSNGTLYYLMIETGDGSQTDTARTATLYKASDVGQLLLSRNLDTSKSGLNMVKFGGDISSITYVADLAYSSNYLGLMLGRQMHKSSDGLNHQGGIAVVFDSYTLNLIKNWGQTSGHSFENYLVTNSSGEFLGIDLGDNYPRGVNLHKFTNNFIHSQVVYTFKTEHGDKSVSPAGVTYPEYPEYPGYYQWSNDNSTYTELGAVIQGKDGYTVLFTGEKSPSGHSLDNSRVGESLNDPRNIGLVKVRFDFENTSSIGSQVADDLVLTNGLTETGGFYTFGGRWSAQRNTGVVWLTNYTNSETENVSRLKAVHSNDGNIILLWEKWAKSKYINTYAMRITDNGVPLTSAIELGSHIRLVRCDNIISRNNKLYIFDGNKDVLKLELVVLELK